MNNTALSGGGLSFNNAVPSSRVSVILRMEEGRVSENRAAGSGGGLYRQGRGAFTMELLGGEISGNIAEGSYGGGVYFYSPADANHLIVEAPWPSPATAPPGMAVEFIITRPAAAGCG